MPVSIPEIINPIHLAEKQRFFEGELLLSKLVRLSVKVKNPEERLFFQLDFSKIGKLLVIKGFIQAKIQLQCQSCLQIVDVEVNSDVNLAIVQSDEAAALIPESYEVLLCNEEKMAFSDIIEDEVLLALPTIPRHQYPCFEGKQAEISIESDRQSKADSPFSVLQNFKKLELKKNGCSKKSQIPI